jgi:hypothetical protein
MRRPDFASVDRNAQATLREMERRAGIDPVVFETAEFEARRTRISKRGSHYLRRAIRQAAAAMIGRLVHDAESLSLKDSYRLKDEKLPDHKPRTRA